MSKKTTTAEAPAIDQMDRATFLRQRLREIETDQRKARASSSWIAVRQFGQDSDRLHAELMAMQDVARKAEANPDELFGDLLALVEDTAEGFPDEDIERLYVACCRRLGLSPVRAVG